METTTLTPGQIVGIISVLTMFSFLVETTVEALIGKPIDEFPKVAKYKKYILTYLAVAIGIYGAFVYNFDLIYLFAMQLQETLGQTIMIASSPLGIVMSGISIGMGSSYLHDLIDKFILQKTEG